MANENVRGRDLAAPESRMEFDGRMYPLRFDMNAFRIAEDVYADIYHKDKNFAEIAMELTRGRLGAIMAMYYAALASAGAEIEWPGFQARFRLTDIPGVRDRLTELLADSMPDPDPNEKGNGAPGPLTGGDAAPGAASPGTGSGTEG